MKLVDATSPYLKVKYDNLQSYISTDMLTKLLGDLGLPYVLSNEFNAGGSIVVYGAGTVLEFEIIERLHTDVTNGCFIGDVNEKDNR